MVISYTAGITTWTDGALSIKIPDGWSAPDAFDPYAAGYFSVDVHGGTLTSTYVDGMTMIIEVSGLPANTGEIIVTYGDKSFGPGATVSSVAGMHVFMVEMSPDSIETDGIPVNPEVNVTAPTPTVTTTNTPIVGDGSASITPSVVTAGSTGNQLTITYNAGVMTWASGTYYGTLNVTIPDGWSAPSITLGQPGYFTVSVINGTLFSRGIEADGRTIRVRAKGLAAGTGQIIIKYGDVAFGPGAVAQNSAGTPVFVTKVDTTNEDSVPVAEIQDSPYITVIDPTPTSTITITITETSTPTVTASATETVTETSTETVTETITQSSTETATETITETVTETATETVTETATQTVTETSTYTVTETVTETATATVTETETETITETATETVTETATETVTETSTETITETATATVTETETETVTETATETVTETATQTATETTTETVTETETETVTETATQTVTQTDTAVNTYTVTETITETATETITETGTQTITETITETATGTVTETATETATETSTQTVTETVTQTATETITETITETATETVTQTITETATETVTETATATITETSTETVTRTITETATQTITGTSTETVTGTMTETATKTATETVTETITQTATQTATDTITATVTETSTPTVTQTNTPVAGQGTASVNPATAAAGVPGNTIEIVYTSGADNWEASPGFGVLRVTIPDGWSAPSFNGADAGYFTVNVTGGSLEGFFVAGQVITINVSGLTANTGEIIITYGDTSQGGTGAVSQPGTGTAVFRVESSNYEAVPPMEIASSPFVDVVLPTETVTPTVTATITETITPTNTPLTGEGTASVAPLTVASGITGNTMIITYTAGAGNWAASPDYGTLRITVPSGWTAPSLAPADDGYVSVTTDGALAGRMVNGNEIIIYVSDLAAGQNIVITYGDTSGGGAGVTAAAPGTYEFLVASALSGEDVHNIAVQPQVEVMIPTPTSTVTLTSTDTVTETVTETITETTTPSVTETCTETVTETSTETITPTITLTSTPDRTPVAPFDLAVSQNGAVTELKWNTSDYTDYYTVYQATGVKGKFNAFPAGWNVIATVLPTPAYSSYSYADATGNTYTYYFVTAVNGAGESNKSTMGVKAVLRFKYTAGEKNTYRIALPYVNKYTKASDIITEIEGSLTNMPLKIDNISLWNPNTQSFVPFGYASFAGTWLGTNWNEDASSLSSNAFYLHAIADFDWIIAGTDKNAQLAFYYNTSKANANKRMIPYTSAYSRASDIVSEIEGSTGAGSDSKINKIALWNPISQSYIIYGYDSRFETWLGTNFDIKPGDAVNIYPSGNSASFTWQPSLVAQPVP